MPFKLSILIVLFFVQSAHAEALLGSLFSSASTTHQQTPRSLFTDDTPRISLIARQAPTQQISAPVLKGMVGSDVESIRALIQKAESQRDGYDAVQHGARIKPSKRPTEMTLGEIFAWIDQTPGQPHAIGRYQFIPQTLHRLVRKTGAGPHERFGPSMQDRLADVLLNEAGLQKFRKGTLNQRSFMNNLAKIWAGLPNSTGNSHYDGYAGNKASITWAYFEAVIAGVSPKRG
jgi:muramidase (phage lysozyme)